MSNSTAQFSTPWATVLTLIFVVLKLTGNITWGWLWVLSPLWICFLLLIVLGILYVLLSHPK